MEQIKRPFIYKNRIIRKRFLQFCRRYRINPEELLAMCEGRLSNFPYWYSDYLRYLQKITQERIRTGVITKMNFNDVWG